MTLENLPRDPAETLLIQDGLDREAADRVYRLARGHPLSLRLAASALAERPDISLEAVTVKAIIEGLTEIYLGIARSRGLARSSMRPLSSVGRRSRCSPRCCPRWLRRMPSTACGGCRSSSSATTGLRSMTPYERRSRPCCGRPIPTAPSGIELLRGASCATRSPAHRTRTCGATPRICSTSWKTRSSGRPSSRPPTTSTPLTRQGRRMARRSPRSPHGTCHRPRRGPSGRGGGSCPRHSASSGTGSIRSPVSTWSARSNG